MDPLKDFKRSRIPFGKPTTIPKDTREVLLNSFGNIRAVIEAGVVTIQTKKLKGQQREVVRINTNLTPPTIELLIEETSA